MTLILRTSNPKALSWCHPIRRKRINLSAKRIAKGTPGSTVWTKDEVRDLVHGDDAAYLREMGVYQIASSGRFAFCSPEDGFLMTLAKYFYPKINNAALLQLAPHSDEMAGKRKFSAIMAERAKVEQEAARINARLQALEQQVKGGVPLTGAEEEEYTHLAKKLNRTASLGFAEKLVPADRLLDAESCSAYNLSISSSHEKFYRGGPWIAAAGNKEDNITFEGELSTLLAAYPERDQPDASFETIKDRCPDIILKDETRFSTAFGIAGGGLMGAVNFGPKRLYHLVFQNARYLLANVAEKMRGDYTVFLGKCDRFIKFFGTPTVGQMTLAGFTEANPAEAQHLIVTKPIEDKGSEREVFPFALVNKRTGQVKYIFSPARLSQHLASLMKKMAVKFQHGATGKEMAEYYEEKRAELERACGSGLRKDEKAELAIYGKMMHQKDVQETEWNPMEIIPGAFIAQKAWVDRLNMELQRLSDKYESIDGKEMARVLRENKGRYNLGDLIYLAMSTSDAGDFEAGFVGKFAGMRGSVNKHYLKKVYTAVRKTVFCGKKIYAINIGEASEVLSFSDQDKLSRSGEVEAIVPGDVAHTQLIEPALTYRFWGYNGSWEYFRRVLGLPLKRRVVQGSYIGANNTKGFWATLRLMWRNFRHWLKRDQIIMYTGLHPNITPDGKIFAYGSYHESDQKRRTKAPFISIGSQNRLGPLSERGTVFYHHQNVGPVVGDKSTEIKGLYATYVTVGSLPGSGQYGPHQEIKQTEYPGKREITGQAAIKQRQALHAAAQGRLSTDSAARREEMLLAKNFQKLADAVQRNPDGFVSHDG